MTPKEDEKFTAHVARLVSVVRTLTGEQRLLPSPRGRVRTPPEDLGASSLDVMGAPARKVRFITAVPYERINLVQIELSLFVFRCTEEAVVALQTLREKTAQELTGKTSELRDRAYDGCEAEVPTTDDLAHFGGFEERLRAQLATTSVHGAGFFVRPVAPANTGPL